MSMAVRNAYELVDGVLDEGLPFVVSYLEVMIKRHIIIVDNNGQIHYPDITSSTALMDDVLLQLPFHFRESEYWYQETNGCLFYRIECNGSYVYAIVRNLPFRMIAYAISILKEAKLAIKYYFTSLNKISCKKNKFERELAEYLFSNNHADIAEIIKLSDKELGLNNPCFLTIIQADEPESNFKWEKNLTYSCEYLKKTKLDIITFAWLNYLVMIIPFRAQSGPLEIETDWEGLMSRIKFKEVLENKFKIRTSQGIGQTYSLLNLHKSFHEARIALTLPRLMGKKDFVQHFSELGIYTYICSQSCGDIKNYCYRTLGPLIQHDNISDGELLSTLRKLLDTSFNWKATSDSLFIHVNTLRYRVDKIEQILGIDLSQMDTRVNLFAAIKVWDTFKIIGFK